MNGTRDAAIGCNESVESLRDRLAQQQRRFQLLDNQMQVLERERQKLAAILHHADAGFVVFDGDGRVTWTNGQFLRSFGEHCHPTSFHRASCQQALCRREAPCEGCPVARAFSGGTTAHHELDLPADGGVRNVYLTAVPIKTMTGEIAEILVMLQDLSDLALRRRSG